MQDNFVTTPTARLLLVDDDPDIVSLLSGWLESSGYSLVTASNGREALTQLDIRRPDAILTDLFMDGMDGLKLLTEVHRRDPVMPVIMLSAQADINDAWKAAHLGVSAFLTKPVQRGRLLEEIQRVLVGSGIDRRKPCEEFGAAIAHQSRVMSSLLERARLVAEGDSSVLITGDTGTGKELLSKAIHDGSPRRDQPFVSVNCSAIPDQLLESELFGHEKGAFTGATSRHDGLFQAANHGTLFLDEVGDMPLSLQVRLLRVLQDFQVRPVGSTKTIPVDVRIISATHRDLEAAVEKGEFREDLYYRLAVVPLHMPRLAERRDDIPLLIEKFLDKLSERRKAVKKRFAPDAREYLASAALPGNIRQLMNVIEQCVVLSTTDIIPLDLVETALRGQPGAILPLEDAKRCFEREYLIGVLRITNGNVSNAAKISGRNRTEFYKLLGRHGLDAGAFRELSRNSVEG